MAIDHNNIWDRLTAQLQEKYSKSEEDSRQMAKDILVKRGHLTEDGELTQEGIVRSNMGAEGRAKDRAIKRSGGTELDYMYDLETNKVKKIKNA